MSKVFNLQKFYKKAYYDDVRGYWNRNSRAWPNCLKEKMDGKGKSKQDAYNECLKEFNTWDKGKWLLTYSECYADSGEERIDHATPGSKGLQDSKKKKT